MPRLTDTQLILLANAAKRDDGAITVPAKLKGDAPNKAIEPLLSRKFCKMVPKTGQLPLWKHGANGEPLSLVITPEGLAAIGVEASASKAATARTTAKLADAKSKRRPQSVDAHTPPTKDGRNPQKIQPPRSQLPQRANSKIAKVVDMMRRPAGVSIKAIMSATGWQRHSVRGAISGAIKKKLGLKVTSEVRGADRFYRIAG